MALQFVPVEDFHGSASIPEKALAALAAAASSAGKPVCCFDLEATTCDLWDENFGIAEIGALKVFPDGSAHALGTLLDPKVPMSPGAVHVTGITDAMLRGAPVFSEAALALKEAFETCLMIGFGSHGLDVRAVLHCLRKDPAGPPASWSSLDLREPWIRHSGSDRGRLGVVCSHFGGDPGNAHRAYDDALSTAVVFAGLADARGLDWLLAFAKADPCATEAPSASGPRKLAEAELAERLPEWIKAGSWDAFGKAVADDDWAFSPKSGRLAWKRAGLRGSVGAATALSELEPFFGPAPAWMAQTDDMRQAVCLLENPGQTPGAEALLQALEARAPNTLAAAKAQLIERGLIEPWTGVAPEDKEPALAAARAMGPDFKRRALLEAVRKSASSEPSAIVAASSALVELGLSRLDQAKAKALRASERSAKAPAP